MEEVSIVTVCTFAGHREVYQANISEALDQALAEIIENDNSIRFLVGGMGSLIRCALRQFVEPKGNIPIPKSAWNLFCLISQMTSMRINPFTK